MAIVYGNTALLQATPELIAELPQWQLIAESILVQGLNIDQTSPINEAVQDDKIGIPLFNWLMRPKEWHLQSLWWPCCGMSRYAIGCFLADGAMCSSIQAATSNFTQPLTLFMGDDTNTGNPTADDTTLPDIVPDCVYVESMYCLQPRAISIQSAPNPIYLLVLVDRRYWFQNAPIGNLSSVAEWEDLFNFISTQLTLDVEVPSISGMYGEPSWEILRSYYSVPLIWDAACWSCQLRSFFYPNSSGGEFSYCVLNGPGDVDDALITPNQNVLAGGKSIGPPLVPALTFIYPSEASYHLFSGGQAYIGTGSPTAGNSNLHTMGALAIHTSYYADYTSGASSPDNQSSCDNYTTAFSSDYYSWLNNSIFDWTVINPYWAGFTGLEDTYHWFFGSVIGGKQVSQTRIQSLTPEFGANISGAGWTELLSSPQLGIVTQSGGIQYGGGLGSVEIYDDQGNDKSLSVMARAFDNLSTVPTFANGQSVQLFWDEWKNEWYLIPLYQHMPYVYLEGVYAPSGSSGNFSWQGVALQGWTTLDNITFKCPDNRGYLITFSISIKPGSGFTSGLNDVTLTIANGAGGAALASNAITIGFIDVTTYSLSTSPVNLYTYALTPVLDEVTDTSMVNVNVLDEDTTLTATGPTQVMSYATLSSSVTHTNLGYHCCSVSFIWTPASGGGSAASLAFEWSGAAITVSDFATASVTPLLSAMILTTFYLMLSWLFLFCVISKFALWINKE